MSALPLNIETKLVHAKDQFDSPWWQSCTVSRLASIRSVSELTNLLHRIPSIKENGFDAISIQVDCPVDENLCTALTSFTRVVHRAGIRMFLTLQMPDIDSVADELAAMLSKTVEPKPVEAGAAKPEAKGNARATNCIASRASAHHVLEQYSRNVAYMNATGIDGVDFGFIDSLSTASTQIFSQLVRTQAAELMDLRGGTSVFSASLQAFETETLQHHLSEDWLHHLRDESLAETAWSAQEVEERVVKEFQLRDQLGRTPVWDLSTATPTFASRQSSTMRANVHRFLSMELFSLSLPGVVYLISPVMQIRTAPQSVVSIVSVLSRTNLGGYRRSLLADALALRRRLNLGQAEISFVSDLDWLPASAHAHVTGDTLVILNPTRESFSVPPEYKMLLSSSEYMHSGSQGTIVLPDACAWFQIRR